MRILFTSYVFAPNLGGIETVSALLAPEFVRAGHEVVLVTKTRQTDQVTRPYEVVRNPSILRMLRLTRWCDVFFQNNISLELAWPLLLMRKPWVIAHHTWLSRAGVPVNWESHLKISLLRYAHNATISRPITDSLPVPSVIVGNPYASDNFKLMPEVPRDRDLVYLGRLVSDKGIDVLVKALAELRHQGLRPRLTIIGSGPEMPSLQAMAERLEVAGQIDFVGPKTGKELEQILNAHKIMVIPSLWPEPFGLVALEGIACGCALVASRIGGLSEAVGPCAITFEPGVIMSLADALKKVLTQPGIREELQSKAQEHLAQFAPADVAQRYLRLFEQAVEDAKKRK